MRLIARAISVHGGQTMVNLPYEAQARKLACNLEAVRLRETPSSGLHLVRLTLLVQREDRSHLSDFCGQHARREPRCYCTTYCTVYPTAEADRDPAPDPPNICCAGEPEPKLRVSFATTQTAHTYHGPHRPAFPPFQPTSSQPIRCRRATSTTPLGPAHAHTARPGP